MIPGQTNVYDFLDDDQGAWEALSAAWAVWTLDADAPLPSKPTDTKVASWLDNARPHVAKPPVQRPTRVRPTPSNGTPAPMPEGLTPYYDQGGITIFHGDSRDILPALPRPDLLVLDPPFNLWPDVPHIDAATVLAFTKWQQRAHVEATYGRPRTEVIWYFKDGRWVSHQLPIVTHETVLVYGELNDVYLGDEQDQTPKPIKSHKSMERLKTARTVYRPRARRALNSVLQFAQNPGTEELGRWAKPAGLMRTLMEWALTGSLVVDPYMGGGTTLRVAKDLGVRAIGIEIEERYCELAARRMGQESFDVAAIG